MTDDNCFTKVFLKKFPLIEEKTIQTLITNGFKNKEILLFLNLDTDLPAIPDISMAQKLVLKRILSEMQTSQKILMQSFEKKLTEEVADIKSNADENQVQTVGQRVTETFKQLSLPKGLTPMHCKPVIIIDRLSTSHELPAISSASDGYLFNPSTSRQTMRSESEVETESEEQTEPKKTAIRPKSKAKKQFGCDECNAKFVYPSNLLIHKRIHTGEKPYTCDYCGQRFRQSHHLNYHRRSIHTGEKPYECEEPNCNKAFISSSDLVRHNLIHTGEKPYRCWVCGKRFGRSSHRNRHKRNVHKN